MAKAIVASATELSLPVWQSGHAIAPASQLMLSEQPGLEVSVADGLLRADASAIGAAGGVALGPVLVEIRVRHAVDWRKKAVLRHGGFNSIEIDLSQCTDEQLADAESFQHLVLTTASRRWIHLADASYISTLAGTALLEISSAAVERRAIRARSGKELLVLEQYGTLHKPGSRQTARFQIPDETVGEDPIPYAPGLYSVSERSFCIREGQLSLGYKIYLEEIEIDPENPAGEQVDMFAESKTSITGTYRVRHRNWRRQPHL